MTEENQYVITSEEITFGKLWNKSTALKGHLGGFWGAYILTFIVGYVCSFYAGFIQYLEHLSGVFIGRAIAHPLFLGPQISALYAVQKKTLGLGVAFKPCNNFGTIVLAYISRRLYAFYWSLLLIVPVIIALSVIIAFYRYFLTDYVIIDNPEMSHVDAIEESCKLMDGFKLKLFGYSLLWSLIFCASLLTFGIALIWLAPKYMAFMASFYESVKAAKATTI